MISRERSYEEPNRAAWPSVSQPTVSKAGENVVDHDNDRLASRTPGPGFLGSTSFSAVYEEDKSLDGLQHGSCHESIIHRGTTQRVYLPNRDSQIKKGMTCLALLIDCPTLGPIIAQWQQLYASIAITFPFTSAIADSVRTSIYSAIVKAQGTEVEDILAQKSAEIYRNSMKEFKIPTGCTIDEYGSILADPSCLRWDALGVYFTAVGLGACYTNKGASRTLIEQRRGLAKKMLEASDTCILLCEELGQMTDAEVFLYCQNAHLVSVVEGDASKSPSDFDRIGMSQADITGYMFWRRLGDLIAAITTKGLHFGNNVTPQVPFWLCELRKRVFCYCYNLDKSISTFMGRPPRLPRKYCAMQLPLDIDLAHLRMPAAQLEIEMEKLDESGWNQAGEYRSNLYSRTSLICNMIREDILELALASLPNDDIAVAENILQRSRSAWDSFPAWIREIKHKPHRELLIAHLSNEIQLNFRYNEFLLYRAVVKRFPTNAANEDELLRLSAETLTSVMNNVTHINLMGKYDCDLPWTLAKFALPTAGVLALELLRQSQGLRQQRPSASFNRSAVIQSLSNLVAALEWAVLPFDGNYEICSQAKQVLQRILDRVLSSPARPLSVATESSSETVPDIPGTGSISSDWWLNQTSSEPEFWSSLPTHPLLMA